MLSLYDLHSVYELNPFTNSTPTLITAFNATGVLGISEVSHDVFYHIVGKWTTSPRADDATWAIWKTDFNVWPISSTHLVDVVGAGFPDGMTTLDCDTILLADASKAEVWYVNVDTAKYGVLNNDTVFGTGSFIGVNGIKVFNSSLYYTNTGLETFGRIPIFANGTQSGDAVVITSSIQTDDFAIDRWGNGWVTTNPDNNVTLVKNDGRTFTVLGRKNSTLLTGAVGAAFGRTIDDLDILYVTTSKGKVVAVDTTGSECL